MFGLIKSWDNRVDVRREKLKPIRGRTWTRRIQWLTDNSQIKLKMDVDDTYKEVIASKKDAEVIWQRFKDGQVIEDCVSILGREVPESMRSRKAAAPKKAPESIPRSVDRLIAHSTTEVPKFVSEVGRLNDMPKPFAPSTLAEFWYVYFHQCVMAQEFRQVQLDGPTKPVSNVQILWYADQAWALVSPTKWDYDRSGNGGALYYVDVPQVFRIGCKHSWTELSPKECRERGIYHGGNCYHVQECDHCEMIDSYDSSG